jgi:hypothetical protein
LPLDTATTPRARSSSERLASRHHPPRILKAPIGCRLSAFTWQRTPPISTGSKGVGGRISAIERAAASTPTRVGICSETGATGKSSLWIIWRT